MSPLLPLPITTPPVPFPVVTTVVTTRSDSAMLTQVYVVKDEQEFLAEPDLPEGIDYDRWTSLVAPAPQGTFRDRLDLLDLEDE